jgi:uncharacterized protein with von Willebrand factor type A (vWA) domain
MDVVGYADRDLMKTALGAVLAKSVDEKALHSRLFDLYFHRDAVAEPPPQDEAESPASEPEGGRDETDGDGESDAADAFMELAEAQDAGRTAMALETAAQAAGTDGIRFASQASFYTRRMLEQMGVKALEQRLIGKLGEHTPEAEAEARRMMDARAALQTRARAYVDARFELFGRAATEAFLNEMVTERQIGALSRTDMERMKHVVARMAKRLAVKHARRRKVKNRGQLDLRRTLRANAGHDGVPFDVVWRTKHKDRPKIVAVCDVSGSVAQYVRFLLLFLFMLREKVTDLETFAFSNHLEDVGPILETREFNAAMDHIVMHVGSASTDYGVALEDLETRFGEVIDRRTTVLILGDGRSNHANPRLDLFQQIADRAKRVVWLCPEPEGSWGMGDSCLLQYRPWCTHLSHCATAADIERAIDEMLLAYD